MDQDQDQTLNIDPGSSTEIDLTTTESAPSAEEPTLEVDGTAEEEAPQEEDVKPEEVDKRSANARIRELNAKAKAAEAKAESLAEQLAKFTGQANQPNPYDFKPTQSQLPVNENGEIDPVAYKNQILQEAATIAQLQFQQQAYVNKVNQEAEASIGKYAVLNPESDTFNDKLSNVVTKATLAFIKANPGASVKEFVDEFMEPYQQTVQKEVGAAQQNMVKNVAARALKPTQPAQSEKRADEMSPEELEKKLGVVY